MENLEITTIEDGKSIRQVPTAAPANIQLFSQSINEFFENAQLGGAAFDPLLGKQPTSGTTFRGQERTVAQGKGLHERRRGQRAKFLEEIYRDFIIPDIVRSILNGKEFLSTLSQDDFSWISDQLAENYANKTTIEDILNGKLPREKDVLMQEFLTSFSKKGNKHVLKILKDEFRGVEVKMGINIAGKQKDLATLSDKVLSIFQFVFANPQAFQQVLKLPGMERAFSDILEFSNIDPVSFSQIAKAVPPTAPTPVTMDNQTLELQTPSEVAV